MESHFFRKMFFYSDPPTPQQQQIVFAENEIVKILMENPHPNIVRYFNVNREYVDMELLTTENIELGQVVEVMEDVKRFLQSLGIMYIDWKLDNIGRDKKGTYKLFDFDASGIADKGKWIIEPPLYYSYKKAKTADLPLRLKWTIIHFKLLLLVDLINCIEYMRK